MLPNENKKTTKTYFKSTKPSFIPKVTTPAAKKSGKGSTFWITKEQLEVYYNLEPTIYKVNPKSNYPDSTKF